MQFQVIPHSVYIVSNILYPVFNLPESVVKLARWLITFRENTLNPFNFYEFVALVGMLYNKVRIILPKPNLTKYALCQWADKMLMTLKPAVYNMFIRISVEQ